MQITCTIKVHVSTGALIEKKQQLGLRRLSKSAVKAFHRDSTQIKGCRSMLLLILGF